MKQKKDDDKSRAWFDASWNTNWRTKELKAKLSEIEKQRDEMKYWIESQKQVESEWNPQEIGRLLGLPIGSSIRAALMPAIQALIKERDEAQAKCAEMREALDKLFVHVLEMIRDYRKGDFDLCQLAALDLKSIEDQMERAQRALSSDCGKGWKSPEQLREMLEPINQLIAITPKRPKAITWESGVEILNYVQDTLVPRLETIRPRLQK